MTKSSDIISLKNSIKYKIQINNIFKNICTNLGKPIQLDLSNLEPSNEQKKTKIDKEKLSSTFTLKTSDVKYKYNYFNNKNI